MDSDGYNKRYYSAYQQASETTDQVQQVVMLYDGAINFIKQAKEAINEKNYEKRYNLINKAIAIVTGLNSCLNFTEETEETAKALDEFYRMIDMRLLYIQCDDSLESCDKVIDDLRRMRNAWADVAKQTAENTLNIVEKNNVEELQEIEISVVTEEDTTSADSGHIHTELQISV